MAKPKSSYFLLTLLCAYLLGCPFISAHAESSGNDKAEASVSDHDPFHSYAPPKLTGEGMADATIKIMNSGRMEARTDQRGKRIQSFVRDFLEKKNFRFLSPYLVAETKEDKRLTDILSPACISKVTTNPDSSVWHGDSSGPFYLFSVPIEHSETKDALLVYGFKSNPYKGATIGEFFVFDDIKGCKIHSEFPVYGWDRRVYPKITFPPLAGVGYRNNRPFIYYMCVQTDADVSYMYYVFLFSYFDTTDSQKENIQSFVDFPKGFNPRSIVESEAHLK